MTQPPHADSPGHDAGPRIHAGPKGPELSIGQTPPPPAALLAPDAVDVIAAVGRYETPLLRYASQLMGSDSEQAQDLVQQAFLRLHRQVQEHGPTSIANLSSWLFRVTHNLVMDLGRKKERDQRVMENAMQQAILTQRDEENDTGTPGSPGELEHREICNRAMAELHRLPDDQKNVLLLKIGQGMSLRQISEVT
ncbi:MAG: sigma-70 family RNA polymerase sigma factor, partial [Terracidiphilus sp.]